MSTVRSNVGELISYSIIDAAKVTGFSFQEAAKRAGINSKILTRCCNSSIAPSLGKFESIRKVLDISVQIGSSKKNSELLLKTAKELGSAIRRLRKDENISQTELAKQIKCKPETITELENGYDRASLIIADRVFRYFGKAITFGSGNNAYYWPDEETEKMEEPSQVITLSSVLSKIKNKDKPKSNDLNVELEAAKELSYIIEALNLLGNHGSVDLGSDHNIIREIAGGKAILGVQIVHINKKASSISEAARNIQGD
jgi:transcriptional regulator with XRE-family HTH domain